MSAHQFLEWASHSKPAIQKIPIVIYTGGVIVEDELKSMVRATFFKPSRLVELQATVQQMCGLVPND
jgi:hypothetical protein